MPDLQQEGVICLCGQRYRRRSKTPNERLQVIDVVLWGEKEIFSSLLWGYDKKNKDKKGDKEKGGTGKKYVIWSQFYPRGQYAPFLFA